MIDELTANLSYRFKVDDVALLLEESGKSNLGFRIAFFIWLLSGDNSLAPLEYYSSHMTKFSDNNENLRGALGPRMLYWVGADQLQEAIDTNEDVTQLEFMVKPAGVNQLKAVYDDLFDDLMPASTIVFRNPSIDFDETNDVPDLISATFVHTKRGIDLILNYESITIDSNFINEVWAFQIILLMFKSWLMKSERRIIVNSMCECDFTNRLSSCWRVEKWSQDFTVNDKVHSGIFHPNPAVFWSDFELLQSLATHIRMQIKGETFVNSDIAPDSLVYKMVECIVDKMQTRYLADFGRALLVCALNKYDTNYSNLTFDIFSEIKTPIMLEVANHIYSSNMFGKFSNIQKIYLKDVAHAEK